MLDTKYLRSEIDKTVVRLASRGYSLDVAQLLDLEKKRKVLQVETEKLQYERNTRSKLIGQAKSRGEDVQTLLDEVGSLKPQLDKKQQQLTDVQQKLQTIMAGIPNLPHPEVPQGKDNNTELHRWGTPRQFSFKIRDHVDIGEGLAGLDFENATKLSGARFVVMKDRIARLHRALAQFMLDTHTCEHGYHEMYVPYLVNVDSLYGTSQLPKFGKELFHIHTQSATEEGIGMSLIPTSEVPLINIVRDSIIEETDLPIKMTSHTPCFRSEAGSHGRDTRGLIRQHQFDKVEMVQIVHPNHSFEALEQMRQHAENILQRLNLPYRVLTLCTGDMSFSSAKTYDLEVWLPAENTYREVSSVSNCGDFQARRMKTRFRSADHKKTKLLHTLNGSGLAVGRTLAAILENYQMDNGSVILPEALRPYMNGLEVIECS